MNLTPKIFRMNPMTFQGSWRVMPSKPEAEKLHIDEVNRIFQEEDSKIKGLPDSMTLTYWPASKPKPKAEQGEQQKTQPGTEKVAQESTANAEEESRDCIELTFNSPALNPPPRKKGEPIQRIMDCSKEILDGLLFQSIRRISTGEKHPDVSLLREKRSWNGWRFWEPETVENFIKRVVKESEKLGKRYQAS
jgi:hypothetical protein